MDDLGKKLKITQMEDWYHISRSHLQKLYPKMNVLFRKNQSIMKLLSTTYPEYPWDRQKLYATGIYISPFSSHRDKFAKLKSQRFLATTLESLFPLDEMIFNFRHPDLKPISSSRIYPHNCEVVYRKRTFRIGHFLPQLGTCIRISRCTALSRYFSLCVFKRC